MGRSRVTCGNGVGGGHGARRSAVIRGEVASGDGEVPYLGP